MMANPPRKRQKFQRILYFWPWRSELRGGPLDILGGGGGVR